MEVQGLLEVQVLVLRALLLLLPYTHAGWMVDQRAWVRLRASDCSFLSYLRQMQLDDFRLLRRGSLHWLVGGSTSVALDIVQLNPRVSVVPHCVVMIAFEVMYPNQSPS
jgi:hypothetical protein